MEKSLIARIYTYIGNSFHSVHYKEGGVDQDKVDDYINELTNVELLQLISDHSD